jgi:hypothetical protein
MRHVTRHRLDGTVAVPYSVGINSSICIAARNRVWHQPNSKIVFISNRLSSDACSSNYTDAHSMGPCWEPVAPGLKCGRFGSIDDNLANYLDRIRIRPIPIVSTLWLMVEPMTADLKPSRLFFSPTRYSERIRSDAQLKMGKYQNIFIISLESASKGISGRESWFVLRKNRLYRLYSTGIITRGRVRTPGLCLGLNSTGYLLHGRPERVW